jgi:hypothetical protein
MKFRIMQTNALRGLLYEFDEVLPEGVNRRKDGTRFWGGNRRQSTNRPSKVATLRQC